MGVCVFSFEREGEIFVKRTTSDGNCFASWCSVELCQQKALERCCKATAARAQAPHSFSSFLCFSLLAKASDWCMDGPVSLSLASLTNQFQHRTGDPLCPAGSYFCKRSSFSLRRKTSSNLLHLLAMVGPLWCTSPGPCPLARGRMICQPDSDSCCLRTPGVTQPSPSDYIFSFLNHSFIHSFKFLLITYYVLGSVLVNIYIQVFV